MANSLGELVSVEAPSNIALIKYMGKRSENVSSGRGSKNLPINSSLSYTLNYLRTSVTVEASSSSFDEWQPLKREGWQAPALSESGQARFLKHFQFLKSQLGFSGHFIIQSANNFPADCGIASSASSFAALTMAAYEVAKKMNPHVDMTWPMLSQLSRIGSGSSIRSFFEPFALWDADGCESLKSLFMPLHHQVVIVESRKKSVSSSEAHQRVISSLLFQGRPERAEHRLQLLKKALGLRQKDESGNGADWRAAYEIVAAEFWDMHALFHTSNPSFQYMNAPTFAVLDEVTKIWEQTGDGPLVTLDAGPNVHLLYRADQSSLAHVLSARIQSLQLGARVLASYEMRP